MDWIDGASLLEDHHHSLQQQLMQLPSFLRDQSNHHPLAMDFTFLANLIESQRLDLDRCLRQREYQIAHELLWQQKERLIYTVRALESKAADLHREKDEELMRIAAMSHQLDHLLGKVEEDREAWQKFALENGAAALSLSNMLDRVGEPSLSAIGPMGGSAAAAVEAAASSSNGGTVGARMGRGFVPCRVCGVREGCMVLLPCRHACVCRPCEGMLAACPLCDTVKRNSVEIFLANNN